VWCIASTIVIIVASNLFVSSSAHRKPTNQPNSIRQILVERGAGRRLHASEASTGFAGRLGYVQLLFADAVDTTVWIPFGWLTRSETDWPNTPGGKPFPPKIRSVHRLRWAALFHVGCSMLLWYFCLFCPVGEKRVCDAGSRSFARAVRKMG